MKIEEGMATNNNAHKFAVVHRGIVQHGFAQLPCYFSFHMIIILLAFIFTFEGPFFGQLRKRSEVLAEGSSGSSHCI
ncbi:hypothetical protein [Halalkalibacter sp. APA_J-10(15)]|uniref:hypothetical protein n=1 Tax=Halalkalibacter sp. APA_J-10(15) TaxID=2933805 RepID=UPI001FF15407|nr:hypothetical protein [Halalkalibacter sp. APA_J-10(15)]MCK0473281.1 hypothetical protein [Halalkalibacter sp. APA_J-10(15)]